MKYILLAVVALSLVGCGGQDNPLAPAPKPTVAATPQAPSIAGNWSGSISTAATYTITGLGTFTVRTVCNETWHIDAQSGTRFSGSFQNSTPAGSTATCVQAGTVSGSISTGGSVSGLVFSVVIGTSTCQRLTGDGAFTGSLSGSSLALSTNDTIRCPIPPLGTQDYTRTLTLFLTRA